MRDPELVDETDHALDVALPRRSHHVAVVEDPCGYEGLAVTDLVSLGASTSVEVVQQQFARELAGLLGYTITPCKP